MSEGTNERKKERTNNRTNNKRTNEQLNEWTNERMNECINLTLEQSTKAQSCSSILSLTSALEEGETSGRMPDSHLYRAINTKLYNSKLHPTRCNVSWSIYFYGRSTCFRWFLRPSSRAHNCTYSFRYCQAILLRAATSSTVASNSSIG
jgi:hypothetical protein